MNGKYMNDLPKAVRNIIHDPHLTQTETSSLKMSDVCKSDYIDGLCSKIENLKDEKQDNVAYGDILQIFTNCTDEYATVFSAIDALNSAISALVNKVDTTTIPADDFIAFIMHKELITNINTELTKMTVQIRKSNFFKQFLEITAWRNHINDKISEPLREKSRPPIRPSNIVAKVSEINKPSARDRNFQKSMAETLPARVIQPHEDVMSEDFKGTEVQDFNQKTWNEKSVNTPVSSRSHVNENRDRSTVA